MKLQINTSEKLIRLEESTNLGELFTQLEELLPDMKWREYSIEAIIVNNCNPPVITFPYEPYVPVNPVTPWITYSVDTNKINIT